MRYLSQIDFDFTPIGLAIKKAREARGMTREEFSGIIGYAPRHWIYVNASEENDIRCGVFRPDFQNVSTPRRPV